MAKYLGLVLLAIVLIGILAGVYLVLDQQRGDGAGAQVAQIPTPLVLPTLTATFTPSLTTVPTVTPITPTLTPSDTPTETPTITLTPTRTLFPTFTFTPTPSLTLTLTPSDTPSPTFTFTPTSDAPQIAFFTASSQSATVNTQIRLSWSTVADSVQLQELNAQGALIQTYDVPTVGERDVVLRADLGSLVNFRLVALRSGQEDSRTIPVNISCTTGWFFGDEFVPPGTQCPTAVGAIGDGEFQPFQRGVMIYVNANNLDMIYALANDGNRYNSFRYQPTDDDDDDDNADDDDDDNDPEGVFAWAWRNRTPPIGGSWNDAFGDSTDDVDDGNRTIQFEQGNIAPFYIDAPGGVIYRFSGGDSGTWSQVKP